MYATNNCVVKILENIFKLLTTHLKCCSHVNLWGLISGKQWNNRNVSVLLFYCNFLMMSQCFLAFIIKAKTYNDSLSSHGLYFLFVQYFLRVKVYIWLPFEREQFVALTSNMICSWDPWEIILDFYLRYPHLDLITQ